MNTMFVVHNWYTIPTWLGSRALEKIIIEAVDYWDRSKVFEKDFNVNFPLQEAYGLFNFF